MFEPAPSRQKIAGQAVYLALWLAITAFGLALTPDKAGHGTHQELGLPPCPSVLLFNRPCPGCGLTTSFTAVLHVQFGAAFAAHPFGPVLYGIFTVTAWLAGWGFFKQARFNPSSRAFQTGMVVFTGAFILFGVFRFYRSPNYQTRHESELAASLKGH